MFRKPKRKIKGNLRPKVNDDAEDGKNNDEEGEQEDTIESIQEARKRVKSPSGPSLAAVSTMTKSTGKDKIMHTFQSSKDDSSKIQKELVTSTNIHHPDEKTDGDAGVGEDGIFRDKKLNKFHAGPIRAAAHVRVTARFDYQPDICKDYKETGFCGFGDTCIYLHDRGDTLSGWQLEQQWEEQQRKKKEQQEKEMQDFATQKKTEGDDGGKIAALQSDDGIPFACHLCRNPFTNPVVTTCSHYFCEACIMNHVRNNTDACPICSKDTGSVFNEPTKLIAKKRKILGSRKAREEDSWEVYAKAFAGLKDDNVD